MNSRVSPKSTPMVCATEDSFRISSVPKVDTVHVPVLLFETDTVNPVSIVVTSGNVAVIFEVVFATTAFVVFEMLPDAVKTWTDFTGAMWDLEMIHHLEPTHINSIDSDVYKVMFVTSVPPNVSISSPECTQMVNTPLSLLMKRYDSP